MDMQSFLSAEGSTELLYTTDNNNTTQPLDILPLLETVSHYDTSAVQNLFIYL